MKMRLISGFVMVALLVVVGQAAQKDVPMKGTGSGQITGMAPGPNDTVVISAIGSGEATHLGKFTRVESITLNPATGAVTGSITFTAADGSELYCDFSGNFAAGGGTYTWTDGTGRFADASGSAGFTVAQSDPVNFSFAFAGSIELN